MKGTFALNAFILNIVKNLFHNRMSDEWMKDNLVVNIKKEVFN